MPTAHASYNPSPAPFALARLYSAVLKRCSQVPVFLGAVFYAFEGIALVLPIENSLSVRAAKASSCFGYEELVVTAMSTVVLIFAIIGEPALM
mgnify:CR=1 FL=1